MKTRATAREYLYEVIRNSGQDPSEWDLEAALDQFRAEGHGWDLDVLDHDYFWGVVAEHDLSK